MGILEYVADKDSLKEITTDICPAAIHTHHRWTLALIYFAQEMGFLDRPCNLVSFDSHQDSLNPQIADELNELLKKGFDGSKILEICEEGLSKNNDDWILASMMLGLISDAVVFGFPKETEPNVEIIDSSGKKHSLWSCTMPSDALDWQGVLSDPYKRDERKAQPMWDLLNWGISVGWGTFLTN